MKTIDQNVYYCQGYSGHGVNALGMLYFRLKDLL